jgi:serine/threonine protein kinase/Tol biopolymer transport system component
MILAPGTRLGPYEILSPLGAGGMGEVWKAKDTRLDRLVAVKVLPEHLAKSLEALARFEREAKAVAALNHPNITGIFDIGNSDGVAYVAMELLEGESLRTRLESGPLPPRKATELAIQMAQGLAAAHEKGVVHRDLKPDNLWITRDGRLKILDFGLAKQLTAIGTGSDSLQPTAAISPGHHTEKGMILGTLGYMSPEQVRGESVDAKSDIFSFGTVLFEMLTGKRAFARDTAADTLVAILTKDPPDLSQTSRPLPPLLQRMLDRCLDKEPARRFQTALDLGFSLDLAQDSGAAPTVSSSGSAETRIRRLTYGRGTVGAARFVPGSRDVMFSARWQGGESEVFSMNPEALEPRSMGLKQAALVAVSAAGELAVKRHPRQWAGLELGQLVRVSPGGSERIELQECNDADWLPDGSRLAAVYPEAPSFWEASLDFRRRRLTTCQGRGFWSLRVSPQGDQLVLFEQSAPVRGDGRIVLIDADGHRTVVAELMGLTGLAWGPGGKDLWFSQFRHGSSSIWCLQLDGNKRQLLQQAGLLELQDVAPDGRVLATLAMAIHGSMGLEAGEAVEQELSWNDANETFDVSRDGSKLLLGAGGYGSSAADRRTIYLRDRTRNLTVRIESGVAAYFMHDDREVLTLSGLTDSRALATPVDAGSAYEVNTGPPRSLVVVMPTPDGSHGAVQDPTSWSYCDFTTGSARRFAGPESTWYFGLQGISPDGKHLVLGHSRGQWLNHPLMIFPLEGGDPVEVAGVLPGDIPARWTGDGRGLFVFNRDSLPAHLHRIDLASGERTLVRTIRPVNPTGLVGISSMALTPDAHFIAYNYTRKLSDLYLIEGLT